MAPSSFSPVGAHVPVAGGLHRGLQYAAEIGAEVAQIFVANPRGWATPPGSPADDKRFADLRTESGLPVYVHSPYLINLGSPTPATYERSLISLAHSMRRGERIGAGGVVVHTGSAVAEGSYTSAMRRVREGLLPLLDTLTDAGPWLLLEPTAGQGRSLCAKIDQLGDYLAALDRHPRVGICFDTCHAFAAGHDLAAPGGMKAALDLLVEVAGIGRLRLVHANDSKDVRGSARDRHERIGGGHIGAEPFAEMFAHPAMAGVPVVLETPGDQAVHAADVALLKDLRQR